MPKTKANIRSWPGNTPTDETRAARRETPKESERKNQEREGERQRNRERRKYRRNSPCTLARFASAL